ncbi:hypothetical protein JDV02_000799 [Purpureocillium takamizusanense]|uniref:Ubiquitin-like modifier HUB1 n=1 Tax=Purpureocillium takamizusanense TaxID=2060973 RepID=A0A9Q8V6S3_9HYPO|nr:uncharacterized protein JDV02_000799 [Purpureocillium takamizusanense]UNI14134.1 hypothetical protein JDV02_000799 [Purpureocillium takamizusanense]
MADSAANRSRSRSRSPPRKVPRGSKGFRWKDSSKPRDDGPSRHDSGRRRDYRDRSPNRDRERNQDGERARDRDRNRETARSRDEAGRDRERLRSPPRRGDGGTKDKDGDKSKRERKDKKDKKSGAAPIAPGQEMIIVHVNDRLGSKTAIPCLPSDTIGQFKLMVAARIGREANQIMLRRQGERPFKDILTLDDYGISNGVQLDLEVDTGD